MRITIFGCGNMGSAMAQRLSQTNELFLFDRHADKSQALEKKGFGKAVQNIYEAVQQSNAIILAIKPQNVEDVKNDLELGKKMPKILISILAGTTINQLKKIFPSYLVVRMMPNLAVGYGEGVMALVSQDDLEAQIKDQVTKLCETLGKVYWMPENKINAFTALAGSGPAYVFAIVEAMTNAGIAMGLDAKSSQAIAQQMIKGSLTVLEETGKHPADLTWQVTSPGGTTIAGLVKYEEAAVSAGIINTFLACYKRTEELTKS